ncbi:MAG: sporulation protein YqfD [Candidatus Coproplasma sp.]
MNNLTRISVTAPPETAVKKLSKCKIAAYNVKKDGRKTLFSVHDNNIKKVFAIFSHPCYNVTVERKSPKNALLSFVVNRCGLFIGGALFIAAALLSDSFIFKITVTGSGSYLKSEVLSIVSSAGARVGSFYRDLDKPQVTSRIMALPQVTFCSVEKRGSVLIVDVQTDEENYSSLNSGALRSDVSGRVLNVVAICGTACVAQNSQVNAGDTLISPYSVGGDGSVKKCVAVGYAHVLVNAAISYAAQEESDENAKLALDSAKLYSDEIIDGRYTVKRTAEGVIYEVAFSYIRTLSINME